MQMYKADLLSQTGTIKLSSSLPSIGQTFSQFLKRFYFVVYLS